MKLKEGEKMEGSTLIWALSAGFSAIFGLILCMWQSLNQRIETVNMDLANRIEAVNTNLTNRIETVNMDLTSRIETVNTNLTNRIEAVNTNLTNRIESVNTNLSNRIEKVDEKVTDVDRRLCRLEGAFSAKDCCMIKEDRHIKKAE